MQYVQYNREWYPMFRFWRVCRRRGEIRKIQFWPERETAITRGVMIWRAVSFVNRPPLVSLERKMTDCYTISSAIRKSSFPIRYYQPSYSSIHYQVSALLKLPLYPGQLGVLISIEHIWDTLGRRLDQLPGLIMNLRHLRHEVARCLGFNSSSRYWSPSSKYVSK